MDKALEQLGLPGWALVATLAAALFVVAFKGIESTGRYKASPRAQDFIVKVKFAGSFGFASAGLSAAIALATASLVIGICIFVGILVVIIGLVVCVDRLARKDQVTAAQAAATQAAATQAAATQAADALATGTATPTMAQAPPAAANAATPTGGTVP